jgi:regulator of RNase E activity RraA
MDSSGMARPSLAKSRTAKFYVSSMLLAVLSSAMTSGATHDPKPYAAIRDIQTAAQPPDPEVTPQYDRDPTALLDAYRHVEVASVSDAIEQLLGRRMYLSHRMQAVGSPRFAGYAVTVRMEKHENHDAHAVDGMLEAIDRGEKNSVYVMSVEDGADVAGMGGLMGTAMAARGFSGAIIDGAVRDTAYLKKIGFPVYATGVTPSTLVGHYKCAGMEVPVVIDGVAIRPGDLITADGDGVAVVPADRAAEIVKLAQELDFKEHSMYPLIEKTKSIEEAVKQFGRL